MAGITDKEVRALIANAQKEGKTLTQADGMIAGLTFTASKAGTVLGFCDTALQASKRNTP